MRNLCCRLPHLLHHLTKKNLVWKMARQFCFLIFHNREALPVGTSAFGEPASCDAPDDASANAARILRRSIARSGSTATRLSGRFVVHGKCSSACTVNSPQRRDVRHVCGGCSRLEDRRTGRHQSVGERYAPAARASRPASSQRSTATMCDHLLASDAVGPVVHISMRPFIAVDD